MTAQMTTQFALDDSTFLAREGGTAGLESNPVPLVIGCAGHDDLREEDHEPLAAQVRDVFGGLRARYPHTPMVLLSALHTMADKLIARAAATCNVRVVHVSGQPAESPAPPPPEWPLPENFERLRPLSLEGAKAAFDAAPSVAIPHTEIDAIVRAVASAEPPEESGKRRPRPVRNATVGALKPDETIHVVDQPDLSPHESQARVGAYIATHSQVFVALWDGVPWRESPGQSDGDPAQAISFRLHGAPREYLSLRDTLGMPLQNPAMVFHVVTPRQGRQAPKRPFRIRQLPVGGFLDKWRTKRRLHRLCQSIDRFNARLQER